VKGGKEKAFAGVFKLPPQNTRQVMEPAAYLSGERLPDMPVPDIGKLLGKEWERYDVGSIGEFDVAVMAEIYAGPDTAIKIYPHWRGGWYYAAKRKNASISGSDDIAMVMVTKWANAAAAAAFGNLYSGTVPHRYKVKSNSANLWQTSEGPVEVSVSGNIVVAIESVPADAVDKVRQAVLSSLMPASH
jgi:hypothetical protein